MKHRVGMGLVVALFGGAALAQTAPPPPPSSTLIAPAPPAGLTVELAEATKLIRDGQYAAARTKVDAALAADPKNPQARFISAVIDSDDGDPDQAVATLRGLTEDYPELPEPHNNLAVIYAQQGSYDQALSELRSALAINPDYGIAHENLGDVYARMAGAEYDRSIAIDKNNKSAQTKLALVRELYAVTPSATVVPAAGPKPATKKKPKK